MRKLIAVGMLLAVSGHASAAATKLVVKFDLPDNKAKCTYRFYEENNKLRYEANPISTNHCPRTLHIKNEDVNDIDVTIPISKVKIDGVDTVCNVKINRLSATSPYEYSFENSNRDCNAKVNVNLETPKA